MNETNQEELMKAIEKFKYKYGIQTPLDMFRLDEIIEEMREEAKKPKRRSKNVK